MGTVAGRAGRFVQDVCSSPCPRLPVCPVGLRLPGSHGDRAVLPHRPRDGWGIFLGGSWLIVLLLPFVCLSGRFSFRSCPDLS